MGAAVVAMAGFGYQALQAFHDPSPRTFFIAAMFILVPLSLALAGLGMLFGLLGLLL